MATENATLTAVKLALRISGSDFDTEILALIDDCLAELTQLGIYNADTMSADPQILSAVTFYCKAHFGNAGDSERWQKIYLSKVTKLQIRRVPEGGGSDG